MCLTIIPSSSLIINFDNPRCTLLTTCVSLNQRLLVASFSLLFYRFLLEFIVLWLSQCGRVLFCFRALFHHHNVFIRLSFLIFTGA